MSNVSITVSSSVDDPIAGTPSSADVDALVAHVGRVGGHPVWSDQHRLALAHRAAGGHLAAAWRGDRLIGVAQIVPGAESGSLAVVTAPDDPAGPHELARALLESVRPHAAGPLDWWWSAPTTDDEAWVRDLGVIAERRLLQLRRPLPAETSATVATRAFRPGQDEAAWLRVNRRAFAGHPEQGRWTDADLAQREREPWFDADGFRLHERDGRLAAFCWTKLHHDAEPVAGEIYVIGVDPDFQGLGLGRQLTLAGLDWIAAQGVTEGMLYVDESNIAAVGLYQALGFVLDHVDVAFTLPPGTPS